ncbi:hypothetical protein RHMOL_Rhmol02G0307700 [Rhododendron molle]|uniref:Uncharacterized protein n=1 Tax=Rhododendron molle TaxID=49168 RepID=A0ACC0PXT6_RHOML|nr:hypothetical protein RHMOL_Rhmol02G0307700 [Rhododendron molle]
MLSSPHSLGPRKTHSPVTASFTADGERLSRRRLKCVSGTLLARAQLRSKQRRCLVHLMSALFHTTRRLLYLGVVVTSGSGHIRITGCLFGFENPVFWVPLDFDDTHLLAAIGIAVTGTVVGRLVLHVSQYVQCNVESQQKSGFLIQMKRCNSIDSSTNQPYGNIWAEIPFVMDIIIQIISRKFFDLLSKRVYGRLIPYMYHQKSKELTWEHFGLCRMMILSRPASSQ